MTLTGLDAALAELVAAARSAYGEQLRRVVLHGSLVRGGFTDDSDIDVVVMVSAEARIEYAINNEIRSAITDQDIRSRIELDVSVIDKYERYRLFDLCYHGRVCSGRVIFDSGKPYEGIRLSREEARIEVVGHYLAQAQEWLESGVSAVNGKALCTARHEAARAACRALHALLVFLECDPSPKRVRWSLRRLCAMASKHFPRFAIKPSRLLAESASESLFTLRLSRNKRSVSIAESAIEEATEIIERVKLFLVLQQYSSGEITRSEVMKALNIQYYGDLLDILGANGFPMPTVSEETMSRMVADLETVVGENKVSL